MPDGSKEAVTFMPVGLWGFLCPSPPTAQQRSSVWRANRPTKPPKPTMSGGRGYGGVTH